MKRQLPLDLLIMAVHPGETLVLLGRSGAGKTTLLKMVNGLVSPTEGEVLFEGQATVRWDLIRLRRNWIDTTDYGPYGGNDMVCSETSRWALQKAGLIIPNA